MKPKEARRVNVVEQLVKGTITALFLTQAKIKKEIKERKRVVKSS